MLHAPSILSFATSTSARRGLQQLQLSSLLAQVSPSPTVGPSPPLTIVLGLREDDAGLHLAYWAAVLVSVLLRPKPGWQFLSPHPTTGVPGPRRNEGVCRNAARILIVRRG